MAAVAVTVLDACGLLFFVYKSMYSTHYDMERECIWFVFFFIRIKFCCITNRHFISTCIFDIHTHTTPESERILMCRIPRCLGRTLRTFRQRPAANL